MKERVLVDQPKLADDAGCYLEGFMSDRDV